MEKETRQQPVEVGKPSPVEITVRCERCGYYISPMYHQRFQNDRIARYSYWRWMEQIVFQHVEDCKANASGKAVL